MSLQFLAVFFPAPFGISVWLKIHLSTLSHLWGPLYLSKEEQAALWVDYMLFHVEAMEENYGKYIAGEPEPTGSMKNNHIEKT